MNPLFALMAFVLALGVPASHAQQPIDAPVLKPFADNQQWLLVNDVEYHGGKSPLTIVVPAGFITDFASIPTIFASFGLSHNGRYSKAAIVHDYLYWSQSCTRQQADNLLLIAMKESLVSAFPRWLVYEGVSAAGQSSWDSNAREKADRLPRIVPVSARNFGPNVLWRDYRVTLKQQGVVDPSFPANPNYCALGNSTDVPGPAR